MTLSGAEGSGANWLGSLHCGRDDRLRQSALQVKAVGITKNHVILRERSEPKDLLQYCSLTFRKQHPEDHSPGIAGRANTSNFASERHQKIVTTIIKSNPGKPFSEMPQSIKRLQPLSMYRGILSPLASACASQQVACCCISKLGTVLSGRMDWQIWMRCIRNRGDWAK